MRENVSGRALRPRWTLCAGVVLALAAQADAAHAQVGSSPSEGLGDRTPSFTVFTHARLVVRPGQVIDDGSLLVRDGVIVSARAGREVPAGAYEVDLGGKTVFPGFIDPLSDYAQVPAPAAEPTPRDDSPSTPPPVPGARHWNARIHPELDLSLSLKPDAKQAQALRKLGYTDVLSAPEHGVLRGQSAALSLADAPRLNAVLLKDHVAQHAAFEFSHWPASEYPASLMGAIALLRQTFYDVHWHGERLAWQARHREAERAEANQALAALAPVVAARQPLFFATSDELDYARALALGQEFGLKLVLVGNGHEYREAARLKAAGVPVVVPLVLPEAPAVEDPDRALDVALSDLEHWEWAPYNARVLADAGVPFALTAAGLKKPDEKFWPALRKVVAAGLDESSALAALTVQPASLLGLGDKLGTLEPGKLAHFSVADADLFRSDKARLYATWIDGRRYEVSDPAAGEPRGNWTLAWRGVSGPAELLLSGEGGELSAKVGQRSFPAVLDGRRLTLYMPGELLGVKRDTVAVVATIEGKTLSGRGSLDDAREFGLSGTQASATPRAPEPAKARPALPATAARFPAGEFGRTALPAQQDLVFRHATVWTQGPQGTLADADVVVSHGKIAAVGTALKVPSGAVEIDARGKHLAPGIIDAHSHMAIAHGVNEGTSAVTSEVRIGDVLDPTDMTVYRQLAGGVTAAQLLHGSANPIGGQSQIIKLRWGADAEGLRLREAPPTIKFALGENVKQANWGDNFTKRYPQTRMGVAEIDLDSFLAAQAYGEKHKNAKKDDEPLRRDLRLEALWEVLQGKRLVQIHSYRQDEILAFARLAQRFHIVPTFQHILEGYKVADVLHELGAGASTFSDWWAYKMEVIDAIPYNGALMTRQGVNVSFNSDSDEMGRRLNTEAAKAVKYGGLSEVEALALVTINPARQLHIDKLVGSIEVGKDADVVLWSGNPLSSLSYPEQTYVDGRRYFDRSEDLAERARIEAERERLIAKALPERVKALAKKEGKDKAGKDDKVAAPEGQPQWATLDAHRLQYLLAPLRGAYHDDEPVNACTDAEAY